MRAYHPGSITKLMEAYYISHVECSLHFTSEHIAHRHQVQSLPPEPHLRKGSLDISTLHEPDTSTLRLQGAYGSHISDVERGRKSMTLSLVPERLNPFRLHRLTS